MNSFRRLLLALLVGPAFSLTNVFALSETDAAAGREVVKRYADAIVGIELVVTVKMTMGDRTMPPRENKIEVNGTVLAPNGLTVTALAAIDPRVQFEAMRGMMGNQRMEVAETDYKETKFRLADGSEIPARVVLKDADLDLAFIVPEPGAPGADQTFPFVDLNKGAEGDVLGDYYIVGRAPKALQRTPLVRATTVVGIVEKPRRLFIMSEQMPSCPIFASDGKALGITVQHFGNGRPSGFVVVPAEDVAEMAKQAAAVKVEAKPETSAAPPAPETEEKPSETPKTE